MKKATSKSNGKEKSRAATKANGKSRYTHAIYYRADGTTRTVKFQQAAPEAKPAAKAAKPAAKAKRTVAGK